MDLKNLTTFIHVAQLGSFTKAGQVLGCSQSTISFQIRQLEDELDFPLFERINRTVVLTDKGREVLAYAQQISKMTAELKHNLQSDNARAVRVRIAMADSLWSSTRRQFSVFHASQPCHQPENCVLRHRRNVPAAGSQRSGCHFDP